MLDNLNFLQNFDLATLIAVCILAFYSIVALAIFLYRLSNLYSFYNKEIRSLSKLLKSQELSYDSYFSPCDRSYKKLEVFKNQAENKLSEGLTWLGIIATTSPFIGLFGTVVSIYLTLISLSGSSDITKIAAPIGQALIATAAGIISAVLAYTFHMIIKRKVFECLNVLDSQSDILADEKA